MSLGDRIDELPPEERELILGGALSERFVSMNTSLTHPAWLGAFYSMLVSFGLFLPLGAANDWNITLWILGWSITSLGLLFFMTLIGAIASFIAHLSQRPPVSVPRKTLYLAPFVGIGWLTVVWIGLMELPAIIGWTLVIVPGWVWLQLTWAPRWRMLNMLEEGVPSPTKAALPIINNGNQINDLELIEVVDDHSPVDEDEDWDLV